MSGGAVAIAGMGASGRLTFYWAGNGSTTWHAETVAGARTTLSAPSVAASGSDTDISAVSAGQRLKFYWAANGTSAWHAETVAGPGSVRHVGPEQRGPGLRCSRPVPGVVVRACASAFYPPVLPPEADQLGSHVQDLRCGHGRRRFEEKLGDLLAEDRDGEDIAQFLVTAVRSSWWRHRRRRCYRRCGDRRCDGSRGRYPRLGSRRCHRSGNGGWTAVSWQVHRVGLRPAIAISGLEFDPQPRAEHVFVVAEDIGMHEDVLTAAIGCYESISSHLVEPYDLSRQHNSRILPRNPAEINKP